MAIIKRTEFLSQLSSPEFAAAPVYLLFGERFLCKQTANQLQKKLLADTPGSVHTIDGDEEDPGQTLARLLSFSLLPGRQIYRVDDSRIFHSKTVLSEIWAKAVQAYENDRPNPLRKHLDSLVQSAGLKPDGPAPLSEISVSEWKKIFGFEKPPGDLAWADQIVLELQNSSRSNKNSSQVDQYLKAFNKGLPGGNILLLTAETVDKRQKLFTYIKKNSTVVDCSVAAGASSGAQTEQKTVLKEMMLKTLASFQKKIEPRGVEIFFERVGFHPVAVVTETEKLAHFVGDRPLITCDDLEEMVARSREDALYELTDSFSKHQIGRTLTILSRLQDKGVHGLAILATMRNFFRKQLIFRSIQLRPSPLWRRGMNARDFQNSYLPELKSIGEWSELLGGHPYALFMGFTKASEYSCSGLKRWLAMLLEAEFRLKGSGLPSRLVLEELFLSMLTPVNEKKDGISALEIV